MHTASRNLGPGLRSGVLYDCYKKEGGGGGRAIDSSPWEEIRCGHRGSAAEMWWDWSDELQACPLGDDVAARL